MKYKSNSKHSVDLDLKYAFTYNNLFGNEKTLKFSIDADFVIQWKCENDVFKMAISNMTATTKREEGSITSSILYYLLSGDEIVNNLLSGYLSSTTMFDSMSQEMGSCPDSFHVDTDGVLNMEWPPLDLSNL